MTTNENKPKKQPRFQIFLEGPEGNRHAAIAYGHSKGDGFSFFMGGQRYVGFKSKRIVGKEEGA